MIIRPLVFWRSAAFRLRMSDCGRLYTAAKYNLLISQDFYLQIFHSRLCPLEPRLTAS